MPPPQRYRSSTRCNSQVVLMAPQLDVQTGIRSANAPCGAVKATRGEIRLRVSNISGGRFQRQPDSSLRRNRGVWFDGNDLDRSTKSIEHLFPIDWFRK